MDKWLDRLAAAFIVLMLLFAVTALYVITQNNLNDTMREIEKDQAETERLQAIIVEYEKCAYEPELISLGEYRLTAYCSCEICCNQYAIDRPIDYFGSEIVYTANGSIARQGYTIAAGPDIPFGTIIVIDGQKYEVQDRGSAITENCIDIYFNDHAEALKFGVKYKEVFMQK